jgi:hypothetical protein
MIEQIYTNTPTLTKGDIFELCLMKRHALQKPCIFGDYFAAGGTIYALGSDIEVFETFLKNGKVPFTKAKKAGVMVLTYTQDGSADGLAEKVSELFPGFTHFDITAKALLEYKLNITIEAETDFLTTPCRMGLETYRKLPDEVLCCIVKSTGLFKKAIRERALSAIESEHGRFIATPEIKNITVAHTKADYIKLCKAIAPDEKKCGKYAFSTVYYDSANDKNVVTDGRVLLITSNIMNIKGDTGNYTIEDAPKPAGGHFPDYREITPTNCTDAIDVSREQLMRWYYSINETRKLFYDAYYFNIEGHYFARDISQLFYAMLKIDADYYQLLFKPNSAGEDNTMLIQACKGNKIAATGLTTEGDKEDNAFNLQKTC